MTMVITAASTDFIIMANDSAVVNEFTDGHKEFETGRKCFYLDGVGCVTMWGARNGNQLIRHLENSGLNSKNTVQQLATQVNHYLTDVFHPHDPLLGDTGYHVAGFSPDGTPHIYHIFWNVRDPQDAVQVGEYSFQHYRPTTPFILHNGRNDLVNHVISAINIEVGRNIISKFNLDLPGLCSFSHFCLRFGAELSDDVSAPFLVHVQRSEQESIKIRFDDETPVNSGYFEEACRI